MIEAAVQTTDDAFLSSSLGKWFVKPLIDSRAKDF